MRLLRYHKISIGKNNYIHPSVVIHKDVIIGSNNRIYPNTIIYPNTVIGNNNVILNGNVIGEHGVNAKETFKRKVSKGVVIGNNNYFHVKNLIFNGYYKKTVFGNDNKILSECHISHDTVLSNNVVLYPRVITSGLTTLMDYATCGIGSMIQQRSVIGKYSMIGMGSCASHNVFPYFIYYNQKYVRLNRMKIPSEILEDVVQNEEKIRNLINELKTNYDEHIVNKYELSEKIRDDVIEFIRSTTVKKM